MRLKKFLKEGGVLLNYTIFKNDKGEVIYTGLVGDDIWIVKNIKDSKPIKKFKNDNEVKRWLKKGKWQHAGSGKNI